jgi:hypothetical protein
MIRSRPLAELNTKTLVKALAVLKAFKDQLTLAQSTNSPIPILATTVSKFSTRSLGTNSNVGTPAPVPVSASAHPENTLNQCHDAKRDPSTPDKSTKLAATQSQKKPRQNAWLAMSRFVSVGSTTQTTDIFVCC